MAASIPKLIHSLVLTGDIIASAEKNIIKDKEKEEITELVETIEESIVTAHEGLHSLRDILGKITIPGKLGFEMLQFLEES